MLVWLLLLMLALFQLLETCAKVHGLGGQDEAAQVVFFALHGHAATQARAHGRHGGATATTGSLARACKADAQRSLAPVDVVVLLVGGRAWHGRLQLQALGRVGGQLEVVAPVVVDVHFLGRFPLSQTLDGAAQQGRRGHIGGYGDAGLLCGRRDGRRVCGLVVGRDEELPVVLGLGLGAHAHARRERVHRRVLEQQAVGAVVEVAVVPRLHPGAVGRDGGNARREGAVVGRHALGAGRENRRVA